MHELTEKIWKWKDSPAEIWDSIITTYLKECVDKYEHFQNCTLKEILGLEETPKPKKPSSEWCEHLTDAGGFEKVVGFSFYGEKSNSVSLRNPEEVKFCPICGAKRPVEKSLVERFKDIASQQITSLTSYEKTYFVSDKTLSQLAQAAIDFLGKEKHD